jgi:hypothetical protein
MDYSMMPDQSAAETARLGRQNQTLASAGQNAARQQALISALRNYGQQSAPQGQMAGKFYVPGSNTAQAMGSLSQVAGSMNPGGKSLF